MVLCPNTNMGIAKNLHWDGPVGCMVNHCAAVQCDNSKSPLLFLCFLFASTHSWLADTSANCVIAAELSFSK